MKQQRPTITPPMILLITAIAGPAASATAVAAPAAAAVVTDGREPRAMIVVDEGAVARREPPPHGAIGMSTAYRISDAVPGRTMEFRKRVLHPGAAIGLHPITHDEVYYVLAGAGVVTSGDRSMALRPGMAAYLYAGATVGIRQTGTAPLALIVSYPLPPGQPAQ